MTSKRGLVLGFQLGQNMYTHSPSDFLQYFTKLVSSDVHSLPTSTVVVGQNAFCFQNYLNSLSYRFKYWFWSMSLLNCCRFVGCTRIPSSPLLGWALLTVKAFASQWAHWQLYVSVHHGHPERLKQRSIDPCCHDVCSKFSQYSLDCTNWIDSWVSAIQGDMQPWSMCNDWWLRSIIMQVFIGRNYYNCHYMGCWTKLKLMRCWHMLHYFYRQPLI